MLRHPFKNSPKADTSSVIGTVASLTAFAVMGWIVHNLMWAPIERRSLESIGPEVPAATEAPTSEPNNKPATPRRTNSNRQFTA
ncbi:MAG: hypothetical protein EOP05_16885 [Proteobacteria bacterium]|nr:MAG: hypothetical protein EOP05_16885 [Pseudomonadota bacterium]